MRIVGSGIKGYLCNRLLELGLLIRRQDLVPPDELLECATDGVDVLLQIQVKQDVVFSVVFHEVPCQQHSVVLVLDFKGLSV